MSIFGQNIKPFVSAELRLAAKAEVQNLPASAFAHLERAHVLGQASTSQHVRAHLHMLSWSLRHRNLGEFLGQLFRLVGATTKTAIGLVPEGNTGGANVSPFMSMPIAPELSAIIEHAQRARPQ